MKRKKKQSILFSRGDRILLTFNSIMLILILMVVLYPLLFVISSSFSTGNTTMSLILWPVEPSLAGYKAVFTYGDIWLGYVNSIVYMISGTCIALVLTVLCAYPLSRADLRGRSFFIMLYLITVYFSGGLIPTYLLVKSLGLIGTRLSVVLPGAVSVTNMIVMRTYFQSSIPKDLYEAASLDGCGNARYLLRIVLPLSGPVLAVIGLYYAVGYWNSYFDAMIYLSGVRKYVPLSIVLREILILNEGSMDELSIDVIMEMEERRKLMKYSVIVISSLPVMMIYPFVQRFFVKGVMIGSLKG